MVREASRLNVRLPLGDVLIRDGELLSEVPYYVRLTDYCIGIVLFLCVSFSPREWLGFSRVRSHNLEVNCY